jgi:predicted enzyme related to lactoylglutathione lyase
MRHALLLLAAALAFGGCAPNTKSPPSPAVQLVTEIFVRDLKASQAFYEKLGFVTTVTEPTFRELQFGGRKLFLSQRQGTPPSQPAANLRVAVADVDRYWALVQSMHAKVLTPIGDRPWGERDFLIADPDGFGLRFAGLIKDGHW